MTLAAVAQMTSTNVISENLKVALGLIRKASSIGAKMIFLPEATDFITSTSNVGQLTYSEENKTFVKEIQSVAKQESIWISIGIHEPVEDTMKTERCFNTQLLINNQGEIQSRYRKTHLFDVNMKDGPSILESNTTIPGKNLLDPIQTPLGKIGLLTCYDLRFPEPSIRLRRLGSEILTYPSAFTVRTGAAHWETLLRARAIETQCYVMASAQVGLHKGSNRTSWGHAMIIDPWGSIIAQCSDMQPFEPSICFSEIDLSLLNETRKSMPLWDQRRKDIYPEL